MTDIRVNPYEVIVAYHAMIEAEKNADLERQVGVQQAFNDYYKQAKNRYEALKDPS